MSCVGEEMLLTDVESGEEICRFVGVGLFFYFVFGFGVYLHTMHETRTLNL